MRFHKNLAMLLVFVAALAWSAASLGQTPGQRKATDKNGTTAFASQQRFGPPQGPVTFELVSKRYDANKDGKVTREEFKGPSQVFPSLDRNSDGEITPGDFPSRANANRPAERSSDHQASAQGLKAVEISEKISPIEVVKVTAEDGNTMDVVFRKPPGKGPFPAIILLHGGMSEVPIERRVRQSKEGRLATRLLKRGFVVVVSTFRTYADNSRDPGPVQDNVAVIEYLKKRPEVNAQSVVVLGNSGGGRLALELSGMGRRTGLAAIVCAEPATTLYAEMYPVGRRGPDMEVSRNYQRYFGKEQAKVLKEKVAKLSCPVLINHGDVHHINIVNNKFLVPEILKQSKQLHTILYPRQGHAFIWGRGANMTEEIFDRVVGDVVDFCQDYLKVWPRPIAERSLGAAIGPVIAQQAATSEPQLLRVSYISKATQKERQFLLYLPSGHGAEKDKKWPVILFLHGGGERGDGLKQLDRVLVHGPLHEAWIQRRNLPFIVISPQMPVRDTARRGRGTPPQRSEDGSVTARNRGNRPGIPMARHTEEVRPRWDESGPPKGWWMSEDDVLNALDTAIDEYKADPKRIYLTGLSYGGFGTWHMAMKFPKRWAAIAPICGAGDKSEVHKLVDPDMPVWIFQGGRDRLVRPEWVLEMAVALEAAGHKSVRLTVHEDLPHNVWTRVYEGEDLYSWFLHHSRP